MATCVQGPGRDPPTTGKGREAGPCLSEPHTACPRIPTLPAPQEELSSSPTAGPAEDTEHRPTLSTGRNTVSFSSDRIRLLHNVSLKKVKENRKQRPRNGEGKVHVAQMSRAAISGQAPAGLSRRARPKGTLVPARACFKGGGGRRARPPGASGGRARAGARPGQGRDATASSIPKAHLRHPPPACLPKASHETPPWSTLRPAVHRPLHGSL